MTKRQVSNPLALAALACLFERPMHPYEMATTTARARQGSEHQAQLRLALHGRRGAATARADRRAGD